jgi:hypothetical protein
MFEGYTKRRGNKFPEKRATSELTCQKGPKTCFPSRAPTDAMLLAEWVETILYKASARSADLDVGIHCGPGAAQLCCGKSLGGSMTVLIIS